MRNPVILLLSLLLINSLSSKAQKFEWARHAGNLSAETHKTVCTDQAGNIYSTGNFVDTVDFDPGPGISNLYGTPSTTSTGENLFIQKNDPSGNLIWVKGINAGSDIIFPGLVGWVYAVGVTIDNNNNIILVGNFTYTVDFDPGPGVEDLTASNFSGDAFILKLDSDGNFIWVKHFTPAFPYTNASYLFDVITDATGNILSTGSFGEFVDLDPGPGQQLSSAASNPIIKLAPNGDLLWAKEILPVNGGASLISVKYDNQGNICIGGEFGGTVDFDPGVNSSTLTGNNTTHLFVAKYDNNCNFLWANKIGDHLTHYNRGGKLIVDAEDNIFLLGEFNDSIDYDPIGTHYIVSNGFKDFFIEKFAPNGDTVWIKHYGGIGHDDITNGILDNNSNLVVCGVFYGDVDFNTDHNNYVLTGTGGPGIDHVNGFVMQLTTAGQLMWVKHFRGTEEGNFANLSSSNVNAIAIDNSDNLYAVGEFLGNVDFDFGPDSVGYNSAGWPLIGNNLPDLYLAKITQNCAVANHCNEDGQSYTCYADYPYINAPASACLLSNNDCSDAPDAWGFCRYNATSWVGWSVNKDNGFEDTLSSTAHFFNNDQVNNIAVPGNLGDAVNWKSKLESTPFNYLVDNNPAQGSIAWWGDHTGDGSGIDASGHVAYVSCVDGDSVTLTEYNFGTNCFYNVRYIDNGLPYASGNWKPDFYIHIEEPMLSVKSIMQNAGVKVYPNPTNSNINVTLEKGFAKNGIIVIYDVVGKELCRQEITNATNYSFNISGLSEGLYFIHVSASNKTAVEKFELIR